MVDQSGLISPCTISIEIELAKPAWKKRIYNNRYDAKTMKEEHIALSHTSAVKIHNAAVCADYGSGPFPYIAQVESATSRKVAYTPMRTNEQSKIYVNEQAVIAGLRAGEEPAFTRVYQQLYQRVLVRAEIRRQ